MHAKNLHEIVTFLTMDVCYARCPDFKKGECVMVKSLIENYSSLKQASVSADPRGFYQHCSALLESPEEFCAEWAEQFIPTDELERLKAAASEKQPEDEDRQVIVESEEACNARHTRVKLAKEALARRVALAVSENDVVLQQLHEAYKTLVVATFRNAMEHNPKVFLECSGSFAFMPWAKELIQEASQKLGAEAETTGHVARLLNGAGTPNSVQSLPPRS